MEKEKNENYFCKICGKTLKIKDELLFCSKCQIFIGKPETYKKSFAPNSPEVSVDTKSDSDLSVMVSIYITMILVVGVSIISYIGFHSGILFGELLCQSLQCIQ